MNAINVAAGATPTTVAVAGPREFIHIYNNSDVTVYLKYDGSATALTVDNGMPLAVGATMVLEHFGSRNIYPHLVQAVHAGAGNKNLRIQGV